MNASISFIETLTTGISITAPIFLAVLAGAILRALNILSSVFIDRTSTVVYWVIMPATLFFGSLKLDLNSDFTSPYLLAGIVVTLLSIGLSLLYTKLRQVPRQHVGIFIQGAYRSNLGLVGLALSVQAYGETGLALATLPIAIWTVCYNILAVIILNTTLSQHQSIAKIATGLLKNPLIWAIILGIAVSSTKPNISADVISAGSFVVKCCLLFALLSVGASLNLTRLRANYSDAVEASIWKLIVTPTISVVVGLLMGVSGIQLAILFLLMAGPTATSSYLMVAVAGGNRDLAADIVMLTSLFFPITITTGLFLLKSFIIE